MRLALATLLVLCAALVPRAGHAQFRNQLYTSPVVASAERADAPAEPTLLVVFAPNAAEATVGEGGSTPALILGGVLGAGGGMVAGAILGSVIDGDGDPDCIDFCFGPGFVLGMLAGEALGMSAGVHLANGRRGAFPLNALTTAGILAAGLVLGSDGGAILVVPFGQLYGAIRVERSTDPNRP
ncbi:hypothetical protein [Longimicrobium sp.]|uniref:hypothetical protein n=1 Tax=Longimicrobium sp. TaxID=2029185 RepID=UPI002E373D7B|nr:hypothetical protein [Longimicrobium sp.]HEX6038328.1 hypothetical protein [Longimicrobium sp.]